MKKIIYKLIGWFGFKLIEKQLIKNNRIIANYSYININKVLEFIFSLNKIENVIQVGANDGKRFDNLNFFLKKSSCKTVLIEPIKEFYNELKINYENHSNIFFENSAISNENKLQYIYTVNQNQLANYDKHISGISSFKKKHLLKHGVKSKDIIKEKVNSLTLKEVLDKYNFTNLDLLVIDAEGYDGYIVNNYFKDCSFQPIIIFEYIHIETHIFEKLIKVLKSKKYNFFKVEENLICFPNNKKIIL
tara:strand:- start:931 stop:1671 length:741 start_codon:yes stop_codon:yes gene_type:complete